MRPLREPREHGMLAFVFPGQGSQAVGMGKALAEAFAPARAVFDEVDAALGEKLTATMWDGPAEKLTLTENAQPALMAVSVAVMRVLQAEAGVDLKRDAKFVAGHSLGEYSALDAARGRCDGRGAWQDQREVAVGAGGCERAGAADQRPQRDRQAAGRAGHRHGALARMRGLYGGCRRDDILRDWLRQGADRLAQA